MMGIWNCQKSERLIMRNIMTIDVGDMPSDKVDEL